MTRSKHRAAIAHSYWTHSEPTPASGDEPKASTGPPCVCCSDALAEFETQTCARCIGRTRRVLTDILELYAILPFELEHRAMGDLPGGQALVMLAGGNLVCHGPRTYVDPAGRTLEEDHKDLSHYTRPDDDDSVAASLASWEDDCRERLADKPAFTHGAFDLAHADTHRRVLSGAVGYLTRNLDRLAQSHPAFDELAQDLARIRKRLEAVTRSGPQREAPCPTCEIPLDLTAETLKSGETVGVWRCPKCHARFTEQQYWLALAQQMTTAAREETG